MLRTRSLMLLLAAPLTLLACSEPPPEEAASAEPPPIESDTLIEQATTDFLRSQPKLASALDLPEDLAGGGYADRLGDYSPEGFESLRTSMARHARRIEGVPADQLDEGQRLDARIVTTILDYYAGSDAADYGYIDDYFGHVPYVVNQLAGPVIDVPNVMTAQQRLESVDDVRDYVARLAAFGPMLDGVRRKLLADAEAGMAMPPAIQRGALAYLDGFTLPAPAQHILVSHLRDAVREIEDMSDGERLQFLGLAEEQVAEVVYPGYRELAEALRGLADRVPEGDGIWAQPNGEAYYADMVRAFGDTDLSPAEIHDIGLAEVARIDAEMDAILRELGYTEGSVGERMTAMGEEPGAIYEDNAAGRAALLADLNTQIEGIMARVPEHFGTLPEQGVEVRRIPEHTEDGAPGGYYTQPSLDGSRPGIYWINLSSTSNWPRHTLPTLTYHEAVPGHHFQIALNMAQTDLPFLRRSAPFNAYIEGWALYSELVAWEMGMYADDPRGDLGRLQAEIYRAARLVVDTGLHHHRWTREQAIEYFAGVTGRPVARVTAEIERYMAWPGQALGYKLGMLRMVELRDEARAALGDAFDPRAFHDVVLLEGAMPMQVLEQRVRDWVAAQQD